MRNSKGRGAALYLFLYPLFWVVVIVLITIAATKGCSAQTKIRGLQIEGDSIQIAVFDSLPDSPEWGWKESGEFKQHFVIEAWELDREINLNVEMDEEIELMIFGGCEDDTTDHCHDSTYVYIVGNQEKRVYKNDTIHFGSDRYQFGVDRQKSDLYKFKASWE